MYIYIYIYIYKQNFKEVNLADIKNCLNLVVTFESLKSITRRQNICH